MKKSIKESTMAFFKRGGHSHDGKNSTKVDFSNYTVDDIKRLSAILDSVGKEKEADEIISSGEGGNSNIESESETNMVIDPVQNLVLETGTIYDQRERSFVDVSWDPPPIREGYYDEYYFDYYYPGDYGFAVKEYEVAIVKESDPSHYDYRTRTSNNFIRFYDIDPNTTYRFYVTPIDSLNNRGLTTSDVIVSEVSYGGVNILNNDDHFFNYDFQNESDVDLFDFTNGPDGSITSLDWEDFYEDKGLLIETGSNTGGNRVVGYVEDGNLYDLNEGMLLSSGFFSRLYPSSAFVKEEGAEIILEAIIYDEFEQEIEIVELSKVSNFDYLLAGISQQKHSESVNSIITEPQAKYVTFRFKMIGPLDGSSFYATIYYCFGGLSSYYKGILDAERTEVNFNYAKGSLIPGGTVALGVDYYSSGVQTSGTNESEVITVKGVKFQRGRLYKVTFSCHRFIFTGSGSVFSLRFYLGGDLLWTQGATSDASQSEGTITALYSPDENHTSDVSFRMKRTSGSGSTIEAVHGSGAVPNFLLVEDIGST